MADSNSDPLSFEGTSPKECEVFVAAIRRRAFDQGKHRDNEWMAGLASTYFIGDALYWYEELAEDVQNDWNRLRPALLARFGRGGTTSTPMSGASSIPTSAPFATIPTPAAAPPAVVSRPLVRKGHLKVLSLNGSLRGYLAKQTNRNGLYLEMSTSFNDALLVSSPVFSVDEAFEFQIIVGLFTVLFSLLVQHFKVLALPLLSSQNASQSPQTSDTLAISWNGISGNKWMDRASSVASCCSLLTVTSNHDWAIERKTWKISKEGELSVGYPRPDGGTERLFVFVTSTGLWFVRFDPGEPEGGRIIFEDIA